MSQQGFSKQWLLCITIATSLCSTPIFAQEFRDESNSWHQGAEASIRNLMGTLSDWNGDPVLELPANLQTRMICKNLSHSAPSTLPENAIFGLFMDKNYFNDKGEKTPYLKAVLLRNWETRDNFVNASFMFAAGEVSSTIFTTHELPFSQLIIDYAINAWHKSNNGFLVDGFNENTLQIRCSSTACMKESTLKSLKNVTITLNQQPGATVAFGMYDFMTKTDQTYSFNAEQCLKK